MSVLVHVTPLAGDDIRQGERYFERQQAGLGDEFVDEVLATLDQIGKMPLGYGEVAEGVRAVGLRRFGYVVFYRSDGAAAEAVAVLHGGRSPAAWQARI